MPIPNPYRGLRGLPADVWIIAATTFVNRVGMMALPFLVLYLTRYLHISPSRAGFAISCYGVGGLVAAPMAGRLADRFGPLVVIRASLAASGTLVLLFPLVQNYTGVLALTFLWAVVADSGRPATMAALTDAASEKQRKAAIAVNRLAVNLGMSVGPAVGGFLALKSFPLLFVVDGLTSLAASAVLSVLLWRRRRGTPVAPEHHEAVAARVAMFSKGSVVWRDRAMLMMMLTSFIANIVFAQHQGAMPLYIVEGLGYKESFYGGLFVLNTLIIVALEVPLNLSMAHWPTKPTLAFATVLIALGFGSLGLVQTPFAIAATVVVWTFGEMIFFPTSTAYVAELAPKGRTGEYMGAFSSTFSLALIIGPWVGATLLDRFGGATTFLLMMACGLVGAALIGVRSSRAEKVAD